MVEVPFHGSPRGASELTTQSTSDRIPKSKPYLGVAVVSQANGQAGAVHLPLSDRQRARRAATRSRSGRPSTTARPSGVPPVLQGLFPLQHRPRGMPPPIRCGRRALFWGQGTGPRHGALRLLAEMVCRVERDRHRCSRQRQTRKSSGVDTLRSQDANGSLPARVEGASAAVSGETRLR